MEQQLAFFGGEWIPAAQASISPVDAGFVQGTTIAEQLRTFGGKLFHLDEHLARLESSLQIIGVDPQMSRRRMVDAARQLVTHNHRLLAPGDDLGLSIFVTPGVYPSYTLAEKSKPFVGMHTYALPFRLWAGKYEAGQALATTDVRQVPADCWPTSVKCRSRMHYYLADKQAANRFSGARAVMLDHQGHVTEASTANVFIYRAGGLVSPPQSKILHGISLATTWELAARLRIATCERDLSADDLSSADEIMLSSTPMSLLPVTQLNGRAVRNGRPGNIFRRLLAAWNDLAGLDIAEQARQFADR